MFVSLDDFKKMDSYQQFIKENPAVGYLKVQVFTAYGAIPIADTNILITKDIGGDKVVFFEGKTDSSGIISDIELPAPPINNLPDPNSLPQYTVYDLTAIHLGYESIKKYLIGMFGGVGVIQYIKMTPKVDLDDGGSNGN